MSPLASGLAGQIGFAAESTYGTFVAPTRFLELNSSSVKFERERIESNGIRAGRRVLHRWTPGIQRVAGDVEFEMAPQGFGLLWLHILGTNNTTGSNPYCVDEETEILTVNGWRRYDELHSGDVVRTLNHETGMAEWQPVESVHVFPAERRQLLSMKTRDHSSLTTLNHRWPVESYRHRRGEFVRNWKTSETLAASDRIIKAAPSADTPVEQKWSDDLVELVAWLYTEGTVTAHGQVKLCQSHQVNADLCDRIESALRRLFGEPSDSLAYGNRTDKPRWRTWTEDRNKRWSLNRAASDLLLATCPEKVPAFWWLRELTSAQLELFIRVSQLADGDGTRDEVRTPRMGQKDPRRADAYQFALILAGYASSVHRRKTNESVVSMHAGTRSCPIVAARLGAQRGGTQASVEVVDHDGIVWCPKTPNMTWLARRNGSVYFTGNTHTMSPGDLSGKSLTVQVGKPDIGGVVRSFSYLGCKITQAQVSAAVNEYAMMNLSFYGNHLDTAQTLGTASYPTGLTPFDFTKGTVTLAAAGFDVKEFDFTIDNGYAVDRHFLRTTTPERSKEPLESTRREITGSMVADFTDLTALNRFINGTEAALVLTFDAGASAKTVITLNVRFDGDDVELGPELLEQPLSFKAISSTSDAAAITVAVTNADTTP